MQHRSLFGSNSASDLCNCKPLLDSSPREGNTEGYSRSLHASLTLENFRRENFRKVSVVTKITKIGAIRYLKLSNTMRYLFWAESHFSDRVYKGKMLF